jgi:hypothetical protein
MNLKKLVLAALALGLLGLLIWWFLLRKIGKPSSPLSEAETIRLKTTPPKLWTSQILNPLAPKRDIDIHEFLMLFGQPNEFLSVRMVTAIAMHESAVFTSNIYKSNNNAFGMKFPVRRETTSLRSENGYAYYESVEDSINDFYMWLGWHNKGIADFPNLFELVAFMKEKGYFEDSFENYYNGCLKHFNTL